MSLPSMYPKISKVETLPRYVLMVVFDNGSRRLYDCTALLEREAFQVLKDEALFRCARADEHGYGVVWNDDVDLAESEVWLNGRDVDHGGPNPL